LEDCRHAIPKQPRPRRRHHLVIGVEAEMDRIPPAHGRRRGVDSTRLRSAARAMSARAQRPGRPAPSPPPTGTRKLLRVRPLVSSTASPWCIPRASPNTRSEHTLQSGPVQQPGTDRRVGVRPGGDDERRQRRARGARPLVDGAAPNALAVEHRRSNPWSAPAIALSGYLNLGHGVRNRCLVRPPTAANSTTGSTSTRTVTPTGRYT
jgi:hypothetical protein